MKTDIPTDSRHVRSDTLLEDLNLNWREKDLPENERTRHVHRLHPYLGKYIPQLVEIFLRKYFAPGQTIVDPFVGSGTTLVQANELGINAVGYDISAFNVMLCRAKTMQYDLAKAKSEILSILRNAKAISNQLQTTLPLDDVTSRATTLSEMDLEYLRAWFAPQALTELLTYRQLIDTNYEYQDLLKVILSRSARSARPFCSREIPPHPRSRPACPAVFAFEKRSAQPPVMSARPKRKSIRHSCSPCAESCRPRNCRPPIQTGSARRSRCSSGWQGNGNPTRVCAAQAWGKFVNPRPQQPSWRNLRVRPPGRGWQYSSPPGLRHRCRPQLERTGGPRDGGAKREMPAVQELQQATATEFFSWRSRQPAELFGFGLAAAY